MIGASHRRQGLPCQDAVLSLEALDPEGEPLQLMAVADGHGGSRYWLSDVGSRLACEQVAGAIRTQLAARPLAAAGWEHWLQEELPSLVQSRWLQAITTDWNRREETETSAFSPLTYGTTLGLVLMCRHWWAAGGLGDWDLLEVPAVGPPRLLNQEPDLGGASEATASLCLDEAASLWKRRCQLVTLNPESSPFTLLLSSDGLRKSCATDEDYRILGAYLCGLPTDRSPQAPEPMTPGDSDPGDEPAGLEDALARITTDGSGDDVSVAIGQWGPPPPESGSRPMEEARPLEDARPEKAPGEATLLVDPAPVLMTAGRGGLSGRLRLGLMLLLVLLSSGAIVLMRDLRPGTPIPEDGVSAAREPGLRIGAEEQAALRRRITSLCSADAATRRATLRNRRSQFEQLRSGLLQRSTLIGRATQDPLGALIAWSQPQSDASKPAAPDSPPWKPSEFPEPCPALVIELSRQWQTLSQHRPPTPRRPSGAPIHQPLP